MKESDRFQQSSKEGHAGRHKIYNERNNVVYFLYCIQCVNVYVLFELFVLRNNTVPVHYVCLGLDDI